MAADQPNNASDGAGARSTPIKRIRWATQRVPGRKGTLKRKSIFARHTKSNSNGEEKKRDSAGSSDPADPKDEQDGFANGGSQDEGSSAAEAAAAAAAQPRTVYFNQPLPASARDEDGKPLQHFGRNKIRTARYTAITFVPKNLWFQFHNIANVYFLIVIILQVRLARLEIGWCIGLQITIAVFYCSCKANCRVLLN